jgi:MFS family permease
VAGLSDPEVRAAVGAKHVRLISAFGVFGFFWGAWAALLPDIKNAVGASDAQLGFALLGVGLGALPAMAFTGRVFDRYGQKSVAPALLAFALAILLPSAASSPVDLFLLLLVVGAASGALDVIINAAVAEEESATERRLMQAAHASFSGVFLVGSVLTGVARAWGAEPPLVLAVTTVLVATTGAFNRRATSPVIAWRADARGPLDPTLLVLGIFCFLVFVVEGGMEAWSALHLERTFDTGPGVGALGPGAFALAMVTGRALAQAFVRRVGDAHVLLVGGVTAAAGAGLAAVASSEWVALVGFFVTGLGASVGAPTLFGLAGRISRTPGTAVGTVATIGYVGFLAGPTAIGWISGLTHLRVGFAFVATVGLCFGVAGAAFVGSRRGRDSLGAG